MVTAENGVCGGSCGSIGDNSMPMTGGVVYCRCVEVFGEAVSNNDGVIGCSIAVSVLLVCVLLLIVVCLASLFALV